MRVTRRLQSEDACGCFISLDNPTNAKLLQSIADPNGLEQAVIKKQSLHRLKQRLEFEFPIIEAVVIVRSYLFTDHQEGFYQAMKPLLNFSRAEARASYAKMDAFFLKHPRCVVCRAETPLGDAQAKPRTLMH